MAQHIPEWLMERYSKLWNKFRETKFQKEQAAKVLKGDKALAVTLSDLKKAGWLTMELDPTDSRRNIYQLTNPHEAIDAVIKGLSR